MLKMKPVTIACCAFLSVGTAFSANDDLALNVAQTLLDEGNSQAGYDLLMADFDPNSTNPLEYRLLGLLAKANNRPREARQYWNKVIELSTSEALTGEAKLELAHIAYILGEGEQATTYLNEVKSNKPPAKVGDNIDAFLDVLENQGTPKNYQFSASVGYLHDSNANAGPTVDSVLMFGLPFTLSNDAKQTSDNALQLNFGFNHNKGITDDMSLQSSMSLNHTNYQDLHSLDSMVLSGSTGLSFRINNELVASVPVVADWVKIGHDKSYYSYSYGIAPQLRYQVDKQLSLNLGSTFSHKKYQSSSDRDSDNYSLSPGIAYQISQQSYLTAGLTAGNVDSGLNYYSNDSLGLNARYGYAFTNGLQASISASYTDSDYDGKEAAYTEARHDKTSTIGINASYPVKSIGAELLFSASHTNNNSNLPIYEYDRNQMSLSLRKVF